MKLARKILCVFGFHRFKHVTRLSAHSDMIACFDCRRRFAMNHSVRCILPWDRELENFYIDLAALEKGPPQ